jgi:secondary thiamine-phosphate synthase enzyme
MPAHVKSTLTGASINIPITKGQLGLGTWQGIWLMEFRTSMHTRTITVTIQGQTK